MRELDPLAKRNVVRKSYSHVSTYYAHFRYTIFFIFQTSHVEFGLEIASYDGEAELNTWKKKLFEKWNVIARTSGCQFQILVGKNLISKRENFRAARRAGADPVANTPNPIYNYLTLDKTGDGEFLSKVLTTDLMQARITRWRQKVRDVWQLCSILSLIQPLLDK